MWQIIKNSLKNAEENILIVFLLAGYEIFSSYVRVYAGGYLSRLLMMIVLLVLFTGMLFLWMGAAAAAYKNRRGAFCKVKDFLKGGLRGLPWALLWVIVLAVLNSALSYLILYFNLGENSVIFWTVMAITAAAAYAFISVPVSVASGSSPGEAVKANKKILKECTLEWFLSGLYVLLAVAVLFAVTIVMYGNLTAVDNQWLAALFLLLSVVLRAFVVVVILTTVVELLLRAKEKFPLSERVDINIKNTYNIE